jgi:hypothetical protein
MAVYAIAQMYGVDSVCKKAETEVLAELSDHTVIETLKFAELYSLRAVCKTAVAFFVASKMSPRICDLTEQLGSKISNKIISHLLTQLTEAKTPKLHPPIGPVAMHSTTRQILSEFERDLRLSRERGGR